MRREVDRTEGDVNTSPARAQWQAEHLDAHARDLLAEDERYFLRQALSTPCLNALERCEGSYLIDAQGRRYLDFHGNSVHQAGYGNPAVLDAVRRQMERLPFCPRRFANRPATELAKRLAEITPGRLGKTLLAPSGALAVGMALKLARVVTGKHKTIGWHGAFHGASLDAISAGDERIFREGLGPLLPGSLHVPPPFRVEGRPVPAEASPEAIEALMRREGDVGAFIAEPVRCTVAGIPPGDYWPRVREICDRHGALLIFDEIPTCLGRTGRLFACEHFGAAPDILCLGKGLGGGVMPQAAMVARPDLDVAEHTALGHYTHEKSPLGAAAALATLDEIERLDLAPRSEELGRRAKQALLDMADRYPVVGEVRGLGLLLAVEIASPDGRGGACRIAERILYDALGRGLSFKISSGNVLTLMPPLTISDAEMDEALAILEACFEAAAR